jgi:large subunit ribosomal protein L10
MVKRMHTKAQKEQLIASVAENARASKALVFTDFKGLTVKETTTLKRELRKSGSSMLVLKKTLLNIALQQANIPVNGRDLSGQVAVAFSSDEVSAAKTIAEFAKGPKYNGFIVGGALGTKALSVDEVKALAKLPTQDEMRAKFLGTLQAPVSSFVRVLGGNISGFVRVLQAVADRKAA